MKYSFDKVKFIKYLSISMILLIGFIVVIKLNQSYSLYESDGEVKVSPNVAFFITKVEEQTKKIALKDLIPSDEPYLYYFTVSNFNGEDISRVDIEYIVKFVTTTNIPLTYKLYKSTKDTPLLINSRSYIDDDGMYFKEMAAKNFETFNYGVKRSDLYILEVNYPITYMTNYEEYSGAVELVDIVIDARQKVDE